MRLLNVTTLVCEDFAEWEVPPYAILSHRWGASRDEVSYLDLVRGDKTDSSGYRKITGFCQCVVGLGLDLDWVWVDTCCIDKASSAELSEAINSMYKWYRAAELCIVYLADVDHTEDMDAFAHSTWFTRGWTLQELLAPRIVAFYTSDWRRIGLKSNASIAKKISNITGIQQQALTDPSVIPRISVARKMAWAAHRMTSRTEDTAYCLLGLFDINMPLLYGEGSKAFYRLQVHIMEQHDDHSLFAWSDGPSSSTRVRHGMLAKGPAAFASCSTIVVVRSPDQQERPPIRNTSRGAEIFSRLMKTREDTSPSDIFHLTLDCAAAELPSAYLDSQLSGDAIGRGAATMCSIALLQKSASEPYTRVNAGRPPGEPASSYRFRALEAPKRFYVRTAWSAERSARLRRNASQYRSAMRDADQKSEGFEQDDS